LRLYTPVRTSGEPVALEQALGDPLVHGANGKAKERGGLAGSEVFHGFTVLATRPAISYAQIARRTAASAIAHPMSVALLSSSIIEAPGRIVWPHLLRLSASRLQQNSVLPFLVAKDVQGGN
jgi:hypothetical protein